MDRREKRHLCISLGSGGMGCDENATNIYPFEHGGKLRSKSISTAMIHSDAPGKIPFSGKWWRTDRIREEVLRLMITNHMQFGRVLSRHK